MLLRARSLLYLASLGLAACGRAAISAASSYSGGSAAKGAVYRMKMHKVIDAKGTGKLAGTYLIPVGWTASDTLTWFPNNYLTPVVGLSKVKSADGLMELDSLSGASVSYGHSPGGDFGMQPPQRLSDLMITSFKQDHPGVPYEIIGREDGPIPYTLGAAPGFQTFAMKGSLKLRFQKDGRRMVSKSQAEMQGFQTASQPTAIGGTMYEGSWIVSGAFTATAPEEALPKAMKLFGFVLASSRIDPHFYNTVAQVQSMIQQNFYARQKQIMDTSRLISQTNSEISDMIMSSYHQREAAQDRSARNFDDTIRGVERYRDSGGEVSLPSGYGHAWSDGNGTYIVSEDSSYNPNQTHSGSWRQLQHAR